ncbi:MAG: L-ascorbate metabolism protein UlaG (beta-lactamase superfamily) [Roseivirga sp.]|jgi:L-ascorbate metabolism protein UlaG (beta-lactamase superfamily)
MIKQFGSKASKEDLEKYQRSEQWDGKKFLNLEETTMDIGPSKIPRLLYKQIFDRKGREPKSKLPIIPLDQEAFLCPSEKVKFIWYGHSVILMRINNKTILIDPMLGNDTSPIAPFTTQRFSENALSLIDDFPPIDLLILTHDHYDHLDLASIEKLKSKVGQYFVALGVSRHLVKWGIAETDITEFDWWDNKTFEGIDITFTPTRHFSGRGLTDRAMSIWGGWAFKTKEENIWFSGDSGYGSHFKTVGDRLGPFDFAFMECGQYNELWHAIHMYPEESIQAAIDGKAHKITAVHWAGFALSLHPWKEPIERFSAEANRLNFPVIYPKIGELFSYTDDKTDHWWEGLE